MLLDEEAVTSREGGRLFTSRASFLEELARIGEPKEAVRGLGEDPAASKPDGAEKEDGQQGSEGDDHPPAAAFVM